MSTELDSIRATIEMPKSKSQHSDYKPTQVSITRFWGGDKRGTSVQLTFQNELGRVEHIQIDQENIVKLIAQLNTCVTELKITCPEPDEPDYDNMAQDFEDKLSFEQENYPD